MSPILYCTVCTSGFLEKPRTDKKKIAEWMGTADINLIFGQKSKGVVRQLRSAQAMAAKAMTRWFKSTRTEVVLALAGLPPADLVGKEMVVLQYIHGTMRRRMEALREGCDWSLHLRFARLWRKREWTCSGHSRG